MMKKIKEYNYSDGYTMFFLPCTEFDSLNNNTMKKDLEYIDHNGYRYWYEHKLARDRVDICLATINPKEYCNGYYLYSTKNPGDGKAFVIVKTNDPNLKLETNND